MLSLAVHHFYNFFTLFTTILTTIINKRFIASVFLNYKSFDYHPPTDMRGTFLDISKGFDKLWYKGLILKLKTYDVNDKVIRKILKLIVRKELF